MDENNLANFIKIAQENNNFLRWNNGNALNNGEPLIVYHGTIKNHFDVVNEEYFNPNSFFGGGLYTTDSTEDANNYASFGGNDNRSYIDYYADKLLSFLENTTTSLDDSIADDSDSFLEFCEDTYDDFKDKFNHFNNINLKEYKLLVGFYIDYCSLEKNLTIEDFKHFNLDTKFYIEYLKKNNRSIDDENNIDIYHFLQNYTLNNISNNRGEIIPLFIKMEKPCCIGFGHNNDEYEETRLYFHPNFSDLDYAIEEQNSIEEDFEFFDEIIQIKEAISEKFNIDIDTIDMDLSSNYCMDYINGEEFFNTIIENDYSNDEDIIEIFKEYGKNIVSFDEKDSIVSFCEDIYIKEYINIDTSSDKYKLSCEFFNDLSFEFNDVISSIHEELYYALDEENNITIYNVFEAIKKHSNDEEATTIFYNILSKHFDGIVMPAYDIANKHWGGAYSFTGVDCDTLHYIVFEGKNVKNALYNNGEYGYTNKITERRTFKEKNGKPLSEMRVENHINYLSKRWLNAPKIEVKGKDFFDNETTDAFIKNDIVYINKDNMTSVKKLEETLIHETVGHWGFRKFTGNKTNHLLNKVSQKYEKELREIAKTYNELDFDNKEDRFRLAEEFIAFRAEKLFPNDKFITKTKNKIKETFFKAKKAFGFYNSVDEEVFLALKNSYDSIHNKKENKNTKLKKIRI